MMRDYQLSEHFKLYELAATEHDDLLSENRRYAWDNRKKLEVVAQDLLEPIRSKFGLPVLVTSGARCPTLNMRIGGARNSQHVECEAADFVVKGLDCMEGSTKVFDWIRLESGVRFGQLIHEVRSGPKTERPSAIWIHISLGEPYRPHGMNREVLRFKNGVYTFVSKGAA